MVSLKSGLSRAFADALSVETSYGTLSIRMAAHLGKDDKIDIQYFRLGRRET